MAEQLLHAAEIRPSVEEVGCRCVPERVGTARRGVAQSAECAVDDVARLPLPEPGSTLSEEEGGSAAGVRQCGTRAKPSDEGVGRRFAEGDGALLVTLAEDPEGPASEVHVVDVEPHEFTDTNPRGVQQLDEGQIANGDGVAMACLERRTVNKPLRLVLMEDFRQVLLPFGSREPDRGVRGDQGLPRGPAEE
jgi:hypothetical protein